MSLSSAGPEGNLIVKDPFLPLRKSYELGLTNYRKMGLEIIQDLLPKHMFYIATYSSLISAY